MAPPRPRSLSKGRPPNAHKPPQPSMKSKATRSLINTTHQLHKDLAKAERSNHHTAADELRRRLRALGGLQAYQRASMQGQSLERGGDSSVVLLEFLATNGDGGGGGGARRMLEVGALSSRNACSRSGVFGEIARIDLCAREGGIEQQDFMRRPLPGSDAERFEVVSLSLVLNFVPSPEARGEMLRRTCLFLCRGAGGSHATAAAAAAEEEEEKGEEMLYPALFLVLPAPCVTNSRYMDEERLGLIMASLGYSLVRRKQTAKIFYTLWRLHAAPGMQGQTFAKKQVRPGAGKNNFSIVLR